MYHETLFLTTSIDAKIKTILKVHNFYAPDDVHTHTRLQSFVLF